jgi:hypothetical protein
VPGAHTGCCAASNAAIAAGSAASAAVTGRSSAGTPARWVNRSASVVASLPATAYSGHHAATGSSQAVPVSWATRSATVAVTPLAQENVTQAVSRSQARRVRQPAPQVDHGAATHEHGHRGTQVPPIGQRRLEDVTHFRECGIDQPSMAGI